MITIWLILSLGLGALVYALSRWQARREFLHGPNRVDLLRQWYAQAPHIPPVRPGVRSVKTVQVARTALRFTKRKGR